MTDDIFCVNFLASGGSTAIRDWDDCYFGAVSMSSIEWVLNWQKLFIARFFR